MDPDIGANRDWPHAAHIVSLLAWLTETGRVTVERARDPGPAAPRWDAVWTGTAATYHVTGPTLYAALHALRGLVWNGPANPARLPAKTPLA